MFRIIQVVSFAILGLWAAVVYILPQLREVLQSGYDSRFIRFVFGKSRRLGHSFVRCTLIFVPLFMAVLSLITWLSDYAEGTL